ncbi:MAG: hypothetical protein U9Q16_00215 [Patescibacteria group bacterium]|nr:hypothetical protein [Patescibacteria group bacterium]
MNKKLFLRMQSKRSKAISLKRPFSLKVFWVLSVMVIFSLLALYIFQVNKGIAERYFIQSQENKLAQLTEENKILEIDSIGISSLDNVLGFLEESNLEKTDKIYYIRVFENEVVTK